MQARLQVLIALFLFNKMLEQDISNIRFFMTQIPLPNCAVITYLLAFLRCWSQESGVELTKIASIFGPYFLRPGDAEAYPEDSINDIEKVSILLLRTHSQVAIVFEFSNSVDCQNRCGVVQRVQREDPCA